MITNKLLHKDHKNTNYRLIVSVFALVLPLICSGSNTINPAIISLVLDSTTTNSSTITFTENSSINTQNPDRGFYNANYNLDLEDAFSNAKEDGYKLVYAPLNLEPYATTTTLPESLFSVIEQNLNDAEAAGVKLILRIVYRPDINNPDPDKDIIRGHFAQLKPLLSEHKEIISVVQAGTIGAWGEWHSFTDDYAETDIDYEANRREIIMMLSDIFPEKYIQIRTPMHKELLFGSSSDYYDARDDGKITSEIAFSDDIRAKIGHHNDCFLADYTDMGTYPSDNISFWKDYVINDTKYAPVGGETCAIGDDEEAELSSCTNALIELKKMNYSFLNDAYNLDVLQKWKDEGCYDEIKQNLGYRLVAQQLTIGKGEDSLALDLYIENKGYAAPYIKSKVTFILKNDLNTYTFDQNIDMRRFYPLETKHINTSIPLDGIASGDYCLALQIGENYSAIRLSNDQLWDEESLSNTLKCNIEIK